MDEVRIRLAAPTEAVVVHRIMQEAFEAARTGSQPSSALDETPGQVRRAMAEGGALLAHVGDQTVGSVRFRWHGRGDGYRVLSFERLAVRPAYRGRGIGTAMIRFVEGHARQGGASAVEVTVRSQQPDNRPYYEALGYRVVGYSECYGIADLRTHMEKWLTW